MYVIKPITEVRERCRFVEAKEVRAYAGEATVWVLTTISSSLVLPTSLIHLIIRLLCVYSSPKQSLMFPF